MELPACPKYWIILMEIMMDKTDGATSMSGRLALILDHTDGNHDRKTDGATSMSGRLARILAGPNSTDDYS